jgi:hypothetical protein
MTLRAPPAAPRTRRRARPRGRLAERHPAPARALQPRHHQHLPAGHRHRGDHLDRSRTPSTDDVRDGGPTALKNPGAPARAPIKDAHATGARASAFSTQTLVSSRSCRDFTVLQCGSGLAPNGRYRFRGKQERQAGQTRVPLIVRCGREHSTMSNACFSAKPAVASPVVVRSEGQPGASNRGAKPSSIAARSIAPNNEPLVDREAPIGADRRPQGQTRADSSP